MNDFLIQFNNSVGHRDILVFYNNQAMSDI